MIPNQMEDITPVLLSTYLNIDGIVKENLPIQIINSGLCFILIVHVLQKQIANVQNGFPLGIPGSSVNENLALRFFFLFFLLLW